MAINSIGQDQSIYGDYTTGAEVVEDKTSLDNDDFMTLLLVELQNQDPTEPMDSDKILSQTSQLATLESTDNTNAALADLAKSLESSNQFGSISAIGKMADLGSNAIALEEDGGTSSFEIYFPSDVDQGSVLITDADGNTLKTLNVGTNASGVYQFDWDGTDNNGDVVEAGVYYASAQYTTPEGNTMNTRVGAYPIESVRFDEGSTLVKVGSSYIPLENIKEIY
jgi:flagellar basal-body rod modification protein FlgD